MGLPHPRATRLRAGKNITGGQQTLSTRLSEAASHISAARKASRDWKPKLLNSSGAVTISHAVFVQGEHGRCLAAKLSHWPAKIHPNLQRKIVFLLALVIKFPFPRKHHLVIFSASFPFMALSAPGEPPLCQLLSLTDPPTHQNIQNQTTPPSI